MLKIPGTAHEQSSGNQKEVTWKISGKGIEIYADEIKWCEANWSSVNYTLGGSDGRIIFLFFSNYPDYVFSTDDYSWIYNDAFFNNELVIQLRKKLRKRKKWPYVLAFSAILFAVVLVWSLFFLKDVLIDSLSKQTGSEWEEQLGNTYIEQLKQSGDLLESDSLKFYFEHLAGGLISNVEKAEKVKFTFHFSKDTSINAFALPGGHIVIQAGLVSNALTAEEVLGVVGHEMAHVTKRHVVKGMLQKFGTYFLLHIFLGEVGEWGDVILNGGTEVLSLSYSREMESEADEWGVKYLQDAGIDSRGLIAFFNTLNLHYGSQSSLKLLSTHPPTAERIKYLEKLTAKNSVNYKPINPKVFADFQDCFERQLIKLK
jgi:beta-barrel assembly-enhancing protease